MAVWETLFSKKNKDTNLKENSENLKTSNIPNNKTLSAIVISPEHPFFVVHKLHNPNIEQNSIYLNLICSDKNFDFASNYNYKSEKEIILKSLDIAANRRLNQAFLDKEKKILNDLDEEAFVYISSDKMLACVLIFPPVGNGEKLKNSKILQNVIDRGVSFGLDFDLLYSIPQDEKRYLSLYLIACGKTPVDGKDGYIVELYSTEVYTNMEKNEISHVDYAHLNLSRRIQKGGVICEIVPPTVGVSGITVTRDLLVPPPKDGQVAVIPKGRNTCLSKDGRYLVAEKDGNVTYVGEKFQVKPILEISHDIKSIDEQHDINFLGDIHIHGDICSGVTIRATGDIQIDGVVEACNIEAGENIVVLGGVQGQYNATLRSHKGIYAKYLEHCHVYAQDVVQADCIIDCNVYSNGTVTAKTGLGAVVCGKIHSANQVSAKVIGSKAEQQIDIILGGLPCDETEKEQIETELNKISNEMNIVSARPKSPKNDEMLSKLRLNQCIAKMKLDKIQKEFDKYNLKICDNDTRLLVCDKIYPKTCVKIGKDFFEVEYEKSNCIIGLNKDKNIDYISNN